MKLTTLILTEPDLRPEESLDNMLVFHSTKITLEDIDKDLTSQVNKELAAEDYGFTSDNFYKNLKHISKDYITKVITKEVKLIINL